MSTFEKLDTFIKEMSHFDPDNMEMGAKEVRDIVISGQIDLQENPKKAEQIRLAFIKQMQSDNYNVHAYAIRCVADMVPKLPSQQVQSIFSKIINSIVDKNLDQKKREVYGVCAGTVIHKAAEQYGSKLSDLFVESIKKLLESKDKKNEIECMLINVISEFMRKWPGVATNPNLKYDRNSLVLYLMHNILQKNSLDIIKKSQTAIGKLAQILEKEHFKLLFEHKDLGLLHYLKKNNQSVDSLMKNMRNGLLCLSQVLKTHNSEIRYWAKGIAEILVDIIQLNKSNDNIEQIDLTCDILENSIACLSYIVKSYSIELKSVLKQPKNYLNNFVEELINFDLQGLMGYMSEKMQVDSEVCDEEQYDYDEGNIDSQQKCWKVRASTINYITYLLKKDTHFKLKVTKSEEFITKLGSKLIEENAIVCQTALEAFDSLMDSISVHQGLEDMIDELAIVRVKSNENQFAFFILKQLTKNLSIILSSTYNDQIKIQCSKLMLKSVKLYQKQLSTVSQMVCQLLKILHHEIKTNYNVECRYTLMTAVKNLIIPSINFSSYEPIITLLMQCINDKSYKIIAAVYKCLNSLLFTYADKLKQHKSWKSILQNIFRKVEQHDADRLIKNSVIKCLGPLLRNIQLLNNNQQINLLQKINIKLKVQIEKTDILQQITYFNTQYQPTNDIIPHLKQIINQLVLNLGNVSYSINQFTIKAIDVILTVLNKQIDATLVKNILKHTKILFNENKIPTYVYLLLPNHTSVFKEYAEMLVKIVNSKLVSQMIQHKIITVQDCVEIIKNNYKHENKSKISEILGTIGVSIEYLMKQVGQDYWGIVCIGGLGYVGDESTANLFIELVETNPSQQIRTQSANALGVIASRYPKIINKIISKTNTIQQYRFIESLKQMVYHMPSTNGLGQVVQCLFSIAQKKHESQSIYHNISECIGQICYKGEIELSKILSKQYKSQGIRYVLAISLRYAFQNVQDMMQSQTTVQYIKKIMQYINDDSLKVKQAATKSLNAIANNHLKIIKPFINHQFLKTVQNNSLINQSLIIIVDYGISKEKKDIGKDLRLQSFNLLKLLLKTSLQSHVIEDVVRVCLDKLNVQSSTDIVLKRLALLKVACQTDFTHFISFQNDFFCKVGTDEGLLKQFKNITNNTDERVEVYLKGVFKEIEEINTIFLKENINQVSNFINALKSIPWFKKLIESI